MTYLKLDVGFPWHHRVIGLSNKAFRAHVIALCHARSLLTDGYISDGLVVAWRRAGVVSPFALRQLIDATIIGSPAIINGVYIPHSVAYGDLPIPGRTYNNLAGRTFDEKCAGLIALPPGFGLCASPEKIIAFHTMIPAPFSTTFEEWWYDWPCGQQGYLMVYDYENENLVSEQSQQASVTITGLTGPTGPVTVI